MWLRRRLIAHLRLPAWAKARPMIEIRNYLGLAFLELPPSR
jgi:hypothetical protein